MIAQRSMILDVHLEAISDDPILFEIMKQIIQASLQSRERLKVHTHGWDWQKRSVVNAFLSELLLKRGQAQFVHITGP